MININVSNSYLNFTRHLALKLSALLALAITVPAQAQNATWTGNGTDTNWTNAANWGGTAPLATGTLTFAGNTQTTNVNNFAAATQFNGINFTNNGTGGATNTAFSLSGSSITVGGNITATSSTAAIQDTIANNLIFNANRNITANGNHTIRLTGDVTLDSTTAASKLIAYNNAAAFSGAGGTIFFTGSSTGGADILSYGGTANATLSRNIHVSKLGTSLAALRSTTTGALTYNGTFTAASNAGFELNGIGSGANDWQSNFGNGNNTATNVSKGGTGNWIISGAIQTGTGIVSVLDGNLTLTNVNNNFTGQVQAVGNGTLNFTSGGALGSGTAVILLGSGPGQGVLNYTGSADTTSARGLKIGNTNNSTGTGRINIASTGNLTFTNTSFMPTQAGYTTNRSLTLGGDGAGVGTIQGAIINSSANSTTSVTKADSGRWILSGNNTYTGATNVTAGTLGLTGNSTSPVALADGTVLQLALASPVTSNSTLSFAGNATVSIVGTPVPATTYNLFTGSAISGTPALSAPISGFNLSNNGTVLQLVPSGGGDTTAPDAPTVALLAGSDTGSSNSDRITNATTPTFRVTLNGTGPTAPAVGDVVELYNGATQVGTATLVLGDINATYVDVTTSVLDPGSLSFTATVTDTAAVPNVSAPSAALSVTLDTTAPVIAAAAPVSSDWGSSYSDVLPVATDETAPANPTVAASGSVNIAKPGAYILSYNATDAAGNPATTVTRTVTVAIANPTAVDASGYTPLLRYALGANGPGDTVAAPVTSATTTELSLTAVVRTDDPKLTVVGTTKTDLTSGTWTTTGVSGSPAGSGTLGDQTGVTAGQRRVYTVTTATKTFLRLEATLAP